MLQCMCVHLKYRVLGVVRTRLGLRTGRRDKVENKMFINKGKIVDQHQGLKAVVLG